MITMNIKKHTRAIAQQLDDDLLAIRLEELVKQIAAPQFRFEDNLVITGLSLLVDR